MVRSYRKGYAAELGLTHELARRGYMTIRAPRSGRIGLPSPDIVAAKDGKLIVIECKSRAGAFTVPAEQLNQLKEWEDKAQAQAYVAWKVPRKGWFFLTLQDVAGNSGRVGKKFLAEKAIGIEAL